MINLRQVECFYAVMRTGSVTQAARILNVTQPAVSIAIKQLESRLKLKLFARESGRLRATPEAEALRPDLEEVFARLTAIERQSQDLALGARGSFSVAATPPLCDGFVVNAVSRFLKERPRMRISIQAISSMMVVDRIIGGEVDIGVVFEPVFSAAVQAVEIGQAEIGCLMRSRHRLARRKQLHVSDLESERLITYLPQALLRPYIDRIFLDGGTPGGIQVLSGHSSTSIALAAEGAGIALVETSLFKARPQAGLVLVPIAQATKIKILLLRPRPPTRSRAIDEFVLELRRAFAAH